MAIHPDIYHEVHEHNGHKEEKDEEENVGVDNEWPHVGLRQVVVHVLDLPQCHHKCVEEWGVCVVEYWLKYNGEDTVNWHTLATNLNVYISVIFFNIMEISEYF